MDLKYTKARISVKKRITALLFSLLTVMFIGIMASAETIAFRNVDQTVYSTQEIQPRADVIVTKYRWNVDHIEYRRWNQTQNKWVDPYWIDLP